VVENKKARFILLAGGWLLAVCYWLLAVSTDNPEGWVWGENSNCRGGLND